MPQRATLKIIYEPTKPGDDEDESDDDEYLKALLSGLGGEEDEDNEDEDEESSDDEEKNGGPSDPSRTKKARKEAAAALMLKALRDGADQESDEDLADASSSPVVNGVSKKDKKGKGKAVALGHDSSEDEDEEEEVMKELVLCTLDPSQVGLTLLTRETKEANPQYTALPATTRYHYSRRPECLLQSLG